MNTRAASSNRRPNVLTALAALLCCALATAGVALAEADPAVPSNAKAGSIDSKDAGAIQERKITATPPSLDISVVQNGAAERSQEEKKHDSSAEWWLVLLTAVLAAVTAWLVIETRRLVGEAKSTSSRQERETLEALKIAREASIAAKKSADIAELDMVQSKRAFVFSLGICGLAELSPGSNQYAWRFRARLENSGDTPTKNMTMHTKCIKSPTLLPDGFDFAYATTEVGTGFIPPKVATMGGLAPTTHEAPISAQDILDAQQGRLFIYVMGWIKYKDVFENTPVHITRFCWLLETIGNSFFFEAGKYDFLEFRHTLHRTGNCADEECD